MCARIKENILSMEGVVTKVFPGAQFEVLLSGLSVSAEEEDKKINDSANALIGAKVKAYVSGRMRVNYVKILVGDRVTIEFGPYSVSMGRITFRHKTETAH